MALETLKGIAEINGEKIVVMDELREQFPERFTETGAMDKNVLVYAQVSIGSEARQALASLEEFFNGGENE